METSSKFKVEGRGKFNNEGQSWKVRTWKRWKVDEKGRKKRRERKTGAIHTFGRRETWGSEAKVGEKWEYFIVMFTAMRTKLKIFNEENWKYQSHMRRHIIIKISES